MAASSRYAFGYRELDVALEVNRKDLADFGIDPSAVRHAKPGISPQHLMQQPIHGMNISQLKSFSDETRQVGARNS